MAINGQGPSSEDQEAVVDSASAPIVSDHGTLKYHLLGPSLTKAGQDKVDQQKVIRGSPKIEEGLRADSSVRSQR